MTQKKVPNNLSQVIANSNFASTPQNMDIINKIKEKTASINLIGAGYVGLTTAALFAKSGFHVLAVDTKLEIIDSIKQGNSPISEPGLQELVRDTVKRGKLDAALPIDANTYHADAIIVSVQTPIDEDHNPNLSFLVNAVTTAGKQLRSGGLIAICSTIPPKTLQEKVKPLLEKISGLKADDTFFLAFVPERIAPGKALYEFVESPRLVGGIGPNSTKVASELFRTVCKKIIETDSTTAEIAKSTENTFRDVNIAFANQLALICEQHGVDVLDVINLANTHPRVNVHYPGPGVGGPCLSKDPYLLIQGTHFKKSNLILLSRQINDSMSLHVIDLIKKGLNKSNKKIKNADIAILGTAYKSNVDDARSSPAEPVIKNLVKLGANVTVFDPYCRASFGANVVNSIDEVVDQSDCLVLMTDHTAFKLLDLQKIRQLMKTNPVIIDTRRVIEAKEADLLGFSYLAIGFSNQ